MGRLTVAGGLALLALCLAARVSAQGQQAAPRQPLTPEQRQARQQARGAAMVQRLDKNADGMVSRDEWSRKPQMFDRLDMNKDGLLDAQELAKAPTAAQMYMQQTRRARMLRERMRRLDTDRDGRISREEWKGEATRFDKLDTNKDGFLTPDELRQALMRRGPGR